MLKIRNHELRFGERTFVMGIVNVSPDSFSGDGLASARSAIDQALEQVEEGADLIDVGGQSTRPGHQPIDEETEIERVLPVIAGIRAQSDCLISVDTFSARVFREARQVGADILNSIWGLTDALVTALKDDPVPVVLMHNKEKPEYAAGVLAEVKDYLTKQAKMATALGLKADEVVLDPGIGFGKTAEHNLEILHNLSAITSLGFPTLLGASRKSTIGKLVGRDPQDRLWGTAATSALAVAHGIDIVRVHDVTETIDVVKVADAIVRSWRPENWSAVN